MVLNTFNLSDKSIRLLQIFFDELSDGCDIVYKMLIKNFIYKPISIFFWIKFLLDFVNFDLLNLNSARLSNDFSATITKLCR